MKNSMVEGVYGEMYDLNDYSYVVYAKDKMLSGGGCASGCSYWQIILVKDSEARDTLWHYLLDNKEFIYVNWVCISEFKKVTRNKKSYSVRDDWALAGIKGLELKKGSVNNV